MIRCQPDAPIHVLDLGAGTGFFRAEHGGERWWLVTPEGNAFISRGANHFHPSFRQVDENRDHWMKAWGSQRLPSKAA
jgi:hypothetical protein